MDLNSSNRNSLAAYFHVDSNNRNNLSDENHYYHTMRHFPDLLESHASSARFRGIDQTRVHKQKAASRSMTPSDRRISLTTGRLEKVDKIVLKTEKLSNRLRQLEKSSYNEIDDMYVNIKKDITATRLHRRKYAAREEQPGLKHDNSAFPPSSLQGQSLRRRAQSASASERAQQKALHKNDDVKNSVADITALQHVYEKLSKAGFLTLSIHSKISDVRTCGLLPVLGLPTHAIVDKNELNSRLQVDLGIKLSSEELQEFHRALFASPQTHRPSFVPFF